MERKGVRIVRRSEYRETPWRNRGGVTFEIARSPEGAEDFLWRLSLARIDRDGPFSDFSGYQRAITLVSGAGCRLHGLREGGWELRERGATALFDGGAAVACELVAGPCEDLNLMVRSPGRIVTVDHFALLANETEAMPEDSNAAVFCLEGQIECLQLKRGERATLKAHDTLLVEPEESGAWRLLRGEADFARAIVHVWAITSN